MSPTVQQWAESVIAAEADRIVRQTQGQALGAVERADLIGAAWLAVCQHEHLSPPALRLRVRGAMRDLLRQEWRAQGRVSRTVRWPVYWPTDPRARYGYRRPSLLRRYCVDCQVFLESFGQQNARKRCAACQRTRRLAQQRRSNAAYYARTT